MTVEIMPYTSGVVLDFFWKAKSVRALRPERFSSLSQKRSD